MVHCDTLASRDRLSSASEIYRKRYPNDDALEAVIRAAVPGAGSGNWGGPLANDPRYAGAFLAMVRAREVLGRLTGARRVAPNTFVPAQRGGAQGAWFGEGKAIPASRGQFDKMTLDVGQLGSLVVMTQELLAQASVDAERMFENDVTAAVVETSDKMFLDPTQALVPGFSPASITHVADYTAPSSGTDAAAVSADVSALVGQVIANLGGEVRDLVFITSTTAAAALAGLRWPSGQRVYPDVTIDGGTLDGVPLLASAACGPQLVLLDQYDLIVAETGIELAASREAAIEMRDDPVGDSVTPTAAPTMISLYQSNTAAIRAVRYAWWEIDPNAVGVVSGFAPAPTAARSASRSAAS
jgi:hypothetical protein